MRPLSSTLVNATISVLIEAEELGITGENIDHSKSSKDPEVLYLLGVTRVSENRLVWMINGLNVSLRT